MNGRGRGFSSGSLSAIFTLQIALNIIVLCFIIAQLIIASANLREIQARQIHYVQDQNTLQLCAQREILVAVRGIGRKLGLPVADITTPEVDPTTCVTLAAQVTADPYRPMEDYP